MKAICNKCNNIKPLSLFCKGSISIKYRGICKECDLEIRKKRYRTIDGLISKIYWKQVTNSKLRKHNQPEYNLGELKLWIKSHKKFIKMYNKWVNSGYKKDLSISINRLDSSKGYCFSNIELVTWRENYMWDIHKNRLLANKALCKCILQLTPYNKFVGKYKSITLASKITGISAKHISEVCKNFRNLAGNYKWRYA